MGQRKNHSTQKHTAQNSRDREIEMANLFVKQAKQYAAARPTYPKELFQFISSKTPSHDLAWDVGTGSGQAAQAVRFVFQITC